MIDQINHRLKIAKLGVSIKQSGQRLSLVATLPPKPGSSKTYNHQQQIFLGIYANAAGFKRAEAEAKILAGKIASRAFTWDDYTEKKPVEQPKPLLIAAQVEQFKNYYFSTRQLTVKSEATWKLDYEAVFKRLPQEEILTAKVVTAAIANVTPDNPNSRTRKKFYQALSALAKFTGLEVDLSLYKSKYSPKTVNLRSLPSDDLIQQHFFSIKYRPWQWVYGMLATFGLRPHEAFFVDRDILINEGICYVTEGKTTDGRVWPLYPEWLDLFNLKQVELPKVTCRLHIDYGHKVCKAFDSYGIPFNPYDLRHSWARRSIEFGLDSRLAAKQMRHSHQVHTSTYNMWLDERTHQKAYDRMLSSTDRPKPPEV